MLPEKIISSKEEVKRRKSAQINNFPSINPLFNNLNTSYKSTSDLCSDQPLFKSNSLFAYQELDQFSSFCDDGSIQSGFLSDFNKNKSQINNINNNNSTKNEEGEQSENSDESFDNNMSEDEVIFKKQKHRTEKRKSAFHSFPSYFKNLSSFNKTNETFYNSNFSNSDKKMSKNDFNNNINNNPNFILSNNSNCPYNNIIRRNSHSINQFRNIFFNNILYQNQNNFIYPKNLLENNKTNNINDKNNFLNNNINNMNNNNQNINYIQNIPPQNPSFNNAPQNNFQNYNNFIHNFPYNNYYNNNPNIINQNNPNTLFNQNQIAKNLEHRRSSHIPLISNFQIMGNEKQIDKGKIKEENPNYFLRDQLYCRQIQSKLEKNVNNVKYSEEFYGNIKPHLIEIIEHQFGNYVIQKFLNVLLAQGNKLIFEDIFIEISDKLYLICVHNYGTRVIQKTFEKLDNGNYSKIETEKLNSIFKSLIEKHLYELCCDKNGNHVYQKLLRIFPKENNKNNFLYEELINYTIQTVFKLFEEKINEKIYKYIDENLLKLSKEKFSSNVIDKCIIKDYDKSNKLIESIIHKNVIKEIIIDQYGNYVVQKAMSVSDKDTCERIAKQIKPMLGELQKTNIGKKIYEKLMINYKDYLQ